MRARNIKPGFFRNEQLMQVAPLGRLLFAGLWCLADREGRLLDRPNQIKWDVLPADDCDVDALLDDLSRRGFIRRYEAEGKRCILITGFQKHQTPHYREKASSLPPPPVISLAQKETSASPDSLIPDSLIPDSLIPDDNLILRSEYLTPTPQQDTLARIIKYWHFLTGETVSLTDRQHIRQALSRGHSEQTVIDLITSLGCTAQAEPLRLSSILAAQLAKRVHDGEPSLTAPTKPPLPEADIPSPTETPLPDADTPSPTEKPPLPDASTSSPTEKPTLTDAAPKPPNFFNRKDGNANKAQAHKPRKPSIDWEEGFFGRG